jgi:hypothetical protein
VTIWQLEGFGHANLSSTFYHPMRLHDWNPYKTGSYRWCWSISILPIENGFKSTSTRCGFVVHMYFATVSIRPHIRTLQAQPRYIYVSVSNSQASFTLRICVYFSYHFDSELPLLVNKNEPKADHMTVANGQSALVQLMLQTPVPSTPPSVRSWRKLL